MCVCVCVCVCVSVCLSVSVFHCKFTVSFFSANTDHVHVPQYKFTLDGGHGVRLG